VHIVHYFELRFVCGTL